MTSHQRKATWRLILGCIALAGTAAAGTAFPAVTYGAVLVVTILAVLPRTRTSTLVGAAVAAWATFALLLYAIPRSRDYAPPADKASAASRVAYRESQALGNQPHELARVAWLLGALAVGGATGFGFKHRLRVERPHDAGDQ